MSVIVFILFVFLTAASKATATANTQLPSCKAKCGDIDIPYPFGIGDGCYAEEYGDFSINCTDDSTAYLSTGNIDILDIALAGELRIAGLTDYDCYDRRGENKFSNSSIGLGDLPFTFSHTQNKFVVIGCDTFAFIQDVDGVGYTGGCTSYCTTLDSFKGMPNGSSCSGLGCCEVPIPRGIKHFSTTMGTFHKYNYSFDFNRCGFIFLAQQGQYTFSVSDLRSNRLRNETLPIVLDWSIGNQTCEEAKKNPNISYACRSDNSECIVSNNGVGYLCNCLKGYQGNPYLARGCQGMISMPEFLVL
ncbi:unnamed protein product [Spirodela intermedia]|uniref:Wall-associated receptor kinase galacturonan-binding domain-containing protein n=1 Tax=Spirodela intermedia TaxID=51605 RepID=A0A7I8KEW3_SPIIN|nr:unnamed protein product [Spirodela intermedia]